MKDTKYKISFIIPAFNGEAYLSRCIDSVLKVGYSEIIIIDDGSTDRTREIAESFSNNHDNIILVNNACNKGVVYSRNKGIKLATGEYISFVDADDWIDSEFYKDALKILNNNHSVDIAIGRIYVDDAKGYRETIFDFCELKLLDSKASIEGLFKWEYYRWELWGKVYRKNLFEGINVDSSIRVGEDLDLIWELFKRAEGSVLIPEYGYHYFFNENSASYSVDVLHSNSYKVFEKVLYESERMLSETTTDIVKRHYRWCLINMIREAVLDLYNDDFIRQVQEKLQKLLKNENERNSIDKRVYRFAENPLTAREIVEDFRAQIIDLINGLNLVNNIVYIYGTGEVAEFLVKCIPKIDGLDFVFVVSDNQMRRNLFQGKQVKYISDIPKEAVIILALNEKTQDVLYVNLLSEGFKIVYKIDTFGIV